MSIFLGVGWLKANVAAQSTSSRLDQIESDYAIDTREKLYAKVFEINTTDSALFTLREEKKEICNELFDT